MMLINQFKSLPVLVFLYVISASTINSVNAFNFFSKPITTKVTTAVQQQQQQQQPNESSITNNIDQKQEPIAIIETKNIMNRRSLLMSAVLAGTVSATSAGTLSVSSMAQADDTVAIATSSASALLESVYFGVGCFWHIQHEFIVAERDLLQRSDRELTSFTGYAGGTMSDSFHRVCYHNFQNVADYGKYGHGEVVGMKLPTDKIVDFANVYFSLYNPKTLDRVDPQDRGAEYRSLIGLPGGTLHPLYPAIEASASKAGFTLQVGKGNDPDTLGKQIVYVYDTVTFPFYQAEIYHQFHNDFQSPAYGATYNKLADLAFADGRIQTTGCPDKV